MASFGKLTNSFLQASQETTVAFANLNFDFALIKFEAPEEYRGLGEALTPRRRASAEDGSAHVTARKLAALFQSAIPDVPNLVQAYGRRASEVAKIPQVNPEAQASERLGIFADHVGADGTTIWAAATSGREAIPMHLLACMLARIWRREEAVPIWCELVEQRRTYLQNQVSDSTAFRMSDLTATRIEITRTQLDEWDASARAWLQTADEAKKREQVQFRLVGDNLSLPVTPHSSLYTSIIETWVTAMQSLEELIQGTPQCIDNGATLLGLASWHLYPDLCLAGTNQYIKQGDPLIASGGIVTLGLKNKENDGMGVFWSLPLSLARYYGNPVLATRHAGIGQSRVSFDEFRFVILGSVLGGWKAHDLLLEDKLNLVTNLVEKAFSILDQALSQAPGQEDTEKIPGLNNTGREWLGMLNNTSKEYSTADTEKTPGLNNTDREWLGMLNDTSKEYSMAQSTHRQYLKQLIMFGQRRAGTLLAHERYWPKPLFGVTQLDILVRSLKRGEQQVVFLQQWALSALSPDTISHTIIRYKKHTHAPWQFTRILLESPDAKRRKTDSTVDKQLALHWCNEYDDATIDGPDENLSLLSSEKTVEIPPAPGAKPEPYDFLCGDADRAAIYIDKQTRTRTVIQDNCATVSQLLRGLEEGWATFHHLAAALAHALKSGPTLSIPYFNSLRALYTASQVYGGLSGAKVDLQVTSRTASLAKWWKMYYDLHSAREEGKMWQGWDLKKAAEKLNKTLNETALAATWSCIAYFESGGINVDPSAVGDQTFAMCYSTSIFVAKRLLNDPVFNTTGEAHKLDSIVLVERIVGNVGKPGLTFLVTPKTLKLRKLDYSSWHMVAHEPFDWKAQDNFQQTSFHLSFTGYEMPLDIGERGRCDVLASVLETAVSVYDKGDWVGDIDILSGDKKWAVCPPIESCIHEESERGGQSARNWSLISIDSWPELLDLPPFQDAIVRAHGNPIARLAAAALATGKDRKVLILPGAGACCWRCVSDVYDQASAPQPEDQSPKAAEDLQDLETTVYADEFEYDEAYAFDLPPIEGDSAGEARDTRDRDDGSSSGKFVLIY